MKRIGNTPYVILEGAEAFEDYVAAQKEWRRSVVAKWRWFLEGKLPSGEDLGLKPIPEKLWESMAILFENQAAVSGRAALEQTTKTDVTLPVRFALPIIRQVYPELIVSKIASIQPLPLSSGGVGQIFYMDFLREDKSGMPSTTTLDSDYAKSTENAIPKRIKMTITSETVTAEKDILAATWSTEVEEDVMGALAIDVQSELVQEAAREIRSEIDYRCLTEIMAGATAGNANWSWTIPAGGNYVAKTWYETLYHALLDAENLIFGARYRSADFVIAGRTLSLYLRKAGDFEPSNATTEFAAGMKHEGVLEGLWDIYTSVFMNTNQGLMGVYPRSQLDTGYVFAPYIPLTPMPLVYADFDPTTGNYQNKDKWTRNIRTRNAHKMVVGALYATITIAA